MRTPAGTNCPYYYADFHRGHSTQECRLLRRSPTPERWEPSLCKSCPVPGILRANACPNMALEAQVVRQWFGLARRVRVYAVCVKYQAEVKDPYVGCGQCHPLPALLSEETNHLK